jgi:hypothetical protein
MLIANNCCAQAEAEVYIDGALAAKQFINAGANEIKGFKFKEDYDKCVSAAPFSGFRGASGCAARSACVGACAAQRRAAHPRVLRARGAGRSRHV